LTTTFDLPIEQHVAQHNITILACDPPCELTVNTVNPNHKTPEVVTLRAILDPEPAKHVLKAARNALKRVTDFKRFRTTSIPQFSMEFKRFPDARIRNNTEKPSARGNYGRLKVPNCEARFEMRAGQRAKFKFLVDLKRAKHGDAFIFHLMHQCKAACDRGANCDCGSHSDQIQPKVTETEYITPNNANRRFDLDSQLLQMECQHRTVASST